MAKYSSSCVNVTNYFQFGYVFGRIAALCYFGGRLPQLFLNYCKDFIPSEKGGLCTVTALMYIFRQEIVRGSVAGNVLRACCCNLHVWSLCAARVDQSGIHLAHAVACQQLWM